MKLAAPDHDYVDDAKRWLNTRPILTARFASAKTTAILAVAEYMANQNGETIYEDMVT